MKTKVLATAATLLALPLAFGDDPPPAPAKPATPPAEAGAKGKHECKISAEAQTAFERMGKTVNGAVQRGMKEASGAMTTDAGGTAVAMHFTVKAPATVTVEPDAKLQGQSQMMARNMARMAQTVVRYAFGIVRPSDEELDAEIVKKDGKEILSETTYKDGAEQSHTEFTLDANGLPASATIRRQPGPGGGGRAGAAPGSPPPTVETVFTWTKSGDGYRLEKIESSGGMAGKTTTTIVYTDAPGYSLPVSWKMENPRFTGETRITEITMDGKKVELTKPDAPKPAPGETPPPDKGGEKK